MDLTVISNVYEGTLSSPFISGVTGVYRESPGRRLSLTARCASNSLRDSACTVNLLVLTLTTF